MLEDFFVFYPGRKQKVIPKIDDKKTGRIEIIVDEENKAPGLRMLQDLGYYQVPN